MRAARIVNITLEYYVGVNMEVIQKYFKVKLVGLLFY